MGCGFGSVRSFAFFLSFPLFWRFFGKVWLPCCSVAARAIGRSISRAIMGAWTDRHGRARLLLDIGRSGARSWRASRCFAAPASRAQSIQLPLARSLGRPQPLGFVGRLAMHSSFLCGSIRPRRVWLQQVTCLTVRSSGPSRGSGGVLSYVGGRSAA